MELTLFTNLIYISPLIDFTCFSLSSFYHYFELLWFVLDFCLLVDLFYISVFLLLILLGLRSVIQSMERNISAISEGKIWSLFWKHHNLSHSLCSPKFRERLQNCVYIHIPNGAIWEPIFFWDYFSWILMTPHHWAIGNCKYRVFNPLEFFFNTVV